MDDNLSSLYGTEHVHLKVKSKIINLKLKIIYVSYR